MTLRCPLRTECRHQNPPCSVEQKLAFAEPPDGKAVQTADVRHHTHHPDHSHHQNHPALHHSHRHYRHSPDRNRPADRRPDHHGHPASSFHPHGFRWCIDHGLPCPATCGYAANLRYTPKTLCADIDPRFL